MAIVRCNECDEFKDDDYFPCEIDPRDSAELVCPDCAAELDEENDGIELTTPPVGDNLAFDAFCKKMESREDNEGEEL